MRRILTSWLMLLAALYGAWQIMPARAQVNLGFGIWKSVVLSAAAPTLDHVGRTATGTSSNPNTLSLQTVAGETCLVAVSANGKTAGTDSVVVTDTASNAWTFRANSQNVTNLMAGGNSWSELKMTATTSATVTVSAAVTPGAVVNFMEAAAWCLSGVNATPFDSNASVPAVATSGAVTISTNHPTSFISNAMRNPGTCSGGWTTLQGLDFGMSCYQRFTTTQLGLSCPDFSINNGIICDAVDGP